MSNHPNRTSSGTIVTLTRHYSGFANVPDKFEVGDHECTDTAVAIYILPRGYTVDDMAWYPAVIRDPSGNECAIVEHDGTGRPQLVSRIGPNNGQPVLAIAKSEQ